jgi:integrase
MAVVTVGWSLGAAGKPKRDRAYLYGKTRAEVADALAVALAKKRTDGAQALAPAPETVSAYLDRWLETAKASLRASTFRSYSQLVNDHIKPEIGSVRLAKLTPSHVQALLTKKLAEGKSPRTVLHIHSALRRALRRAVDLGLISRNVATVGIDKPRAEKGESAYLDALEIQRLLAGARTAGDRLVNLYALAVAEGMRQGEALGLKWSDVNWDTNQLSISRDLERNGGVYELGETKSAKHRTMTLSKVSREALLAQLDQQAAEKEAAGSLWRARPPFDDLIFTTAAGDPLNGTQVTHQLQNRLEALGLRKVRFHDLRHSCASLLLARGVPMKVVSEKLGHSTIRLTMDTYSRVSRALDQDAADEIDRALTPRLEVVR